MAEAAVRPATLDDLDAICGLADDLAAMHHAAWPGVFAPADGGSRDRAHWAESIVGDHRAALVAQVDGRTVGFVTLLCSVERHSLLQTVRVARVMSISVAKSARGQGIGKTLMREAETWAKAQQAADVRLVVWAFNEDAVRLYRELGYEVRSLTMGKMLDAE